MYKFLKNPKILFPFFMALIMASIMSGVLILINIGFVEKFFSIWLRSFLIAFTIAFPTVLLYQIPSLKVLKKIKILTSYFWLKISKKPQLYGDTASFFKNFYLKNILL